MMAVALLGTHFQLIPVHFETPVGTVYELAQKKVEKHNQKASSFILIN